MGDDVQRFSFCQAAAGDHSRRAGREAFEALDYLRRLLALNNEPRALHTQALAELAICAAKLMSDLADRATLALRPYDDLGKFDVHVMTIGHRLNWFNPFLLFIQIKLQASRLRFQ